jgi:HSP20 family molecular chaperone IbpA
MEQFVRGHFFGHKICERVCATMQTTFEEMLTAAQPVLSMYAKSVISQLGVEASPYDLYKRDHDYIACICAIGVGREFIDIALEKNVLHVSVSAAKSPRGLDWKMVKSSGRSNRKSVYEIELANDAVYSEERMSARLEKGVLTITVVGEPRASVARRKIIIE